MKYREATTGCWPFWLGGAVVSIAMGVMVVGGGRHRGDWVRNKASMQDIDVALGHYRTEYDSWPDDPSLATSDVVPVKVRGPLLDAVIENNPRGIMFLFSDNAEHDHSLGLVREHGVRALHDSWGTCYFLMLDMNRDGQVKNPEHLPGAVPDPRAKPLGEFLPMLKAVFSAGPDRDPNTWADNITTWR